MLDVVVQKNSALPVEGTIGTVVEIVGGVVSVGGSDAVDQDFAVIGDVVTVGVLEENDVGLAGDQDSAVPEFEGERTVDFCELGDAVGVAILVVVVQDEQGVVHFLNRIPFRIGRPGGDPEAALGIDVHLNGIDQVGEFALVGEQVGFKALGDGKMLRGLLRR